LKQKGREKKVKQIFLETKQKRVSAKQSLEVQLYCLLYNKSKVSGVCFNRSRETFWGQIKIES
jgi:hypothetical protein